MFERGRAAANGRADRVMNKCAWCSHFSIHIWLMIGHCIFLPFELGWLPTRRTKSMRVENLDSVEINRKVDLVEIFDST
jgi:hypothetical protein